MVQGLPQSFVWYIYWRTSFSLESSLLKKMVGGNGVADLVLLQAMLLTKLTLLISWITTSCPKFMIFIESRK